VSECCDCNDEIFIITVGRVAADDLSIAPGSPPNSGALPADTVLIRGTQATSFNQARTVDCVIHSDWCEHRPTKAAAEIVHDTAAPNGTIRVFVEAARDFSKYVFSEIEYQANVSFPELDERWHYADQFTLVAGTNDQYEIVPANRPRLGGGYEEQLLPDTVNTRAQPIFGTANGGFVFTPQNKQDGDSYATSPWPLTEPQIILSGGAFGGPPKYHTEGDRYRGTRLLIRWGYRQHNEDTILGEVSYLDHYGSALRSTGPPFFVGKGSLGYLSVGCDWEDIYTAASGESVRCGIEIYAPRTFLLLRLQDVSKFGYFSQSFNLPRSFFSDTESDVEPLPPLPYQLVGMSRASPIVQVPVGLQLGGGTTNALIGDSTLLSASRFVSTLTCGARRGNALIYPDQQENSDVLPPAVIGPAEPPPLGPSGSRPVTQGAPFVIRRPDLLDLSDRHVANAASWHASHLVRSGSPLAERNALHNLHLEIVEAPMAQPVGLPGNFPDPFAPERPLFYTNNSMPAYMLWFGQRDYVRRNFSGWAFGPVANSGVLGPMFTPVFLSDVGGLPEDSPLPPLWMWNAMAGAHTLEPFAPSGGRLTANAYQAFYQNALHTIENEIAAPLPEDIDLPGALGPLTEAEFAEYESLEHPAMKDDYRVEWSIETYPQLWARSDLGDALNIPSRQVGPLDLPIETSGMTSERYDRFSRGGARWQYIPDDTGATITIHSRVNVRINITRVTGFRRRRQRLVQNRIQFDFWEPTDEVGVYGDHECNDVAWDEKLFSWKIPLDASDLAALSAGDEVTKELLAGSYDTYPDPEDENPTPVDVYRTVKLRVSKI
jgi:hypothetical protein